MCMALQCNAWLLVFQDHFTGLCYTRPLPSRKRPKLVAFELNQIFGLICYPNIFHTDNGKEFTAKTIVEILKAMNGSIVTVTGRPRKPSNQGLVENVNKLIWRVMADLEESEQQKGKCQTGPCGGGGAVMSCQQTVWEGKRCHSFI